MKFEESWRVPLDIEELKQLPQAMQDCYDGLYKYAKPAKIDYLWLVWRYDEEIEKNVFDLFVAIGGNTNDDYMPFSGSGGRWFVWFNENKDYNLTGQERIALRNKCMQYQQLMAKNYMGEGVAKCV